MILVLSFKKSLKNLIVFFFVVDFIIKYE